MKKQVFVLKTYGAELYKWSPIPNNKNTKGLESKKPYFCTAFPGSQGEDWITTYCYNVVVVDGKQKRLAYVECDYVE